MLVIPYRLFSFMNKINTNIRIIFNINRHKSYKKYLIYSHVPKIDENDLDEKFVRGSGPGGQATNKTNNAVTLKHKPTGIVVKCHQTRSLWQNSKIARELLIKKLDNLLNGEKSLENQEKKLRAKDNANNIRKKKKMLALKKAFLNREGLE